ncbi:hypothetical protein [Sporichthya polymorpha]|uniref:hypothetical protein n=1 Tax=Sporichthya polymorpha TaxID=35751 RepID=UPI000380561E|nr:hypothetical protein [Sporichthya polymorpha]
MSQHGRRRAAPPPVVDDEPVRRVGPLTAETALVLALVAVIALGSVFVQWALPSNREAETVIGDQKVRITTVGKGGVEPGPVEPRVVQQPVATPIPVGLPPVATPKPLKTPKPARTPKPTPTPDPNDPVVSPLPGGGGGGGGGGRGDDCTVLILCRPGQTPKATPKPDPGATTAPEPGGEQPQPEQPQPKPEQPVS